VLRTTVKKSSQIQSVDASAPAIPERVSVAMIEIAENMHERDVTTLAGPKGKHDRARTAVRANAQPTGRVDCMRTLATTSRYVTCLTARDGLLGATPSGLNSPDAAGEESEKRLSQVTDVAKLTSRKLLYSSLAVAEGFEP
jgi:hypothetical protein